MIVLSEGSNRSLFVVSQLAHDLVKLSSRLPIIILRQTYSTFLASYITGVWRLVTELYS